MPWVTEYADSVDSQLQALHPKNEATVLDRAVSDALSAGGKRVRATLSLLWCEALCGDYRPAIPLAAAYELAHASALVQDDIIDHSDKRRGGDSVVAKYGLATAILASDLLLFNVPKMVARYEGLGSRRLARVFDLVGEACRATTWGEFLDQEMAGAVDNSEEDYQRMIRLKTSTLLSAPCASGAIVGGGTDDQVGTAHDFGEALGVAYQIQDDILDLVGDEFALGKPVFTDLRGGKKCLVIIHCMKRCSPDDRNFIVSLLNRSGPYSEAEVAKLKELMERYGSLEYAHGQVMQYTSKAKEKLSPLPEGKAKASLVELVDYLSARYY